MAKVSGQLHSDLAKGSVGPVTHRVYCGTGTASKHRSSSRKRLTKLTIKSPVDIGNCWSRHSADIGYTLRIVPPDTFLKSLADQVGGFGTLSQLDDVRQPLWFPSDTAHGNQPYILPDGINDFISGSIIVSPFTEPFEIWIIAADCAIPLSYHMLFSLNSGLTARVGCPTGGFLNWFYQSPTVYNIAPLSDGTVKVWRIVFSTGTIQVFWNGIAQNIPLVITPPAINRLRLFATRVPSQYYSRRLFEITTFRRILNPVEAQLLLHYLFDFYNLP